MTGIDVVSTAAARARVVISINTAWNIANFRGGLIRALIARGYEVIAIAPPDEYAECLIAMGCRFIPIGMDNKGANPLRDMALFFRFLRALRRERPVAFLGYTIKPNVYGSLAAQSLAIPVINNISGLGTAFIRNTWLTRVVKLLYRVALARSEIVFFQNDDDRRLFVERRLVRIEQVKMLPGSGIDLERFKPAEPSEKAPASAGLRFLLVARLLYDKGVGEYVEAARLVRRMRPEARFSILGFLDAQNRTAVQREELEQWVGEGIIDYLGTADDVRPFIAAADCVVLPSYREGTPRSLLEAAAMGKALIATNVPGCREVVDHGVNGLLCRVRDAPDLAARMTEFIDMAPPDRFAMGAAGRRKMEREFDERFVIRSYLEAMQHFLRAH